MSSEKQAEAGEKAPLVHGQPPSYSQPAPTVIVQPVIMQPPQLSEPMPPDYLPLSIFTLLCCFWPLSVFALIKSLEVRSSYQNGYYQGSLSASRSSLLFNRLSIGVGIAIWVILALAQLSWIIPIAALGTRAEERQKLLGGEGESGDEQPTATDLPPPMYIPSPPLSAVKAMGPPPKYPAQPSEKYVVYIHDGERARGLPMPRDYLALSIFTLICCFLPLSLFALIKSIEVRSSYQGGRYMDSVNASQSSLFFNRLSIFVGIIVWVIVMLLSLCYYFFVIESLRNNFMQLNP